MPHDKATRFASDDRFLEVEHLAPRFFREVLDFNYDDCLVSDGSSLADFVSHPSAALQELSEMLDRLEAHYFIDARPLDSLIIVDLLELLAERGVID